LPCCTAELELLNTLDELSSIALEELLLCHVLEEELSPP
jgi:hypothetical protein